MKRPIHRNPVNNWIHASEFPRIVKTMYKAATTKHTHWMDAKDSASKYLAFYVDQRTGDFLVKDYDGASLTDERIFKLFPELEDDGLPEPSVAPVNSDTPPLV